MKFGKSICILNVGGTKYAFPMDVIKDFPLRRVSRLHNCASEKEVLEVCDDYDRERNEFFFDRHSEAFVFIMLYVKSGKLRFVPQMCELSFYNEMIYWGLESSHLEFCCQRRLDDRMSDTYTYFSEEDIKTEQDLRDDDDLDNPTGDERGSAKWLERMRRTFEEPTSSVGRTDTGICLRHFCDNVHGDTVRKHTAGLGHCQEQQRRGAQVHREFGACPE